MGQMWRNHVPGLVLGVEQPSLRSFLFTCASAATVAAKPHVLHNASRKRFFFDSSASIGISCRRRNSRVKSL